MNQDPQLAESLHHKFITEIVKNKSVWGLTNVKRWATASSSFYKKAEVMPFWSNESDAQLCAKEDWKGYHASEISLVEFLENWCAGLYEDHLLVGTNWTEELFGNEIEPLDLVLEILSELKLKQIDFQFNVYKSLEDFELIIKEMIENERED